jgi:hypothetical protein
MPRVDGRWLTYGHDRAGPHPADRGQPGDARLIEMLLVQAGAGLPVTMRHAATLGRRRALREGSTWIRSDPPPETTA